MYTVQPGLAENKAVGTSNKPEFYVFPLHLRFNKVDLWKFYPADKHPLEPYPFLSLEFNSVDKSKQLGPRVKIKTY